MSYTNTKNCFNPFYYTTMSCDSCWKAIDSSLPADASDAQRGDKCYEECQWICWPLIFTFDIVSCPFRGAYFVQQKYCSCKNCDCKIVNCCKCCNSCKTYPTIDIQPL